jgi:cytochrome b
MAHRVRVWDLPTRLFHWLLAACVIGSLASGWIGGGAIDWHARFGYGVLALLLFRLVWGFIGGRWSRFASFIYAPRSVAAYLQGQPHPDHLVGHNPLGAGSVFAILLVLLAQVATGLVNDDEISFQGPLYGFVSSGFAGAAHDFHADWGQWLVLALVVLHVAAVLFYLVKKRQNLVGPMVGGDKEVPNAVEPSRDDLASRLVAAVVFVLCWGVVWWIMRLGGAA